LYPSSATIVHDFRDVEQLHFKLEILEDRIHQEVDQTRLHPIQALEALSEFNPRELTTEVTK
jgi:hypothetical protein